MNSVIEATTSDVGPARRYKRLARVFGRYVLAILATNLILGAGLGLFVVVAKPELNLGDPLIIFLVGPVFTLWAFVGVATDPWLGIPILVTLVLLGLAASGHRIVAIRGMLWTACASGIMAVVAGSLIVGVRADPDTASWGSLRDPIMLFLFLPLLLASLTAYFLNKFFWSKAGKMKKKVQLASVSPLLSNELP
jgi:hypothetical protein